MIGMSPLDDKWNLLGGDDPYEQAKVVFDYVKIFAEAAGGSLQDIVRTTVYVADIEQRKEIVRARNECFDFENPPCTAMLGGLSFAVPGMLLEVDAWGILGCGDG